MDFPLLWSRFRSSYRKNAPEFAALTRGLYPRFVFAARPGELAGEVPVFHYHDVEPLALERDLSFLATNGYHPLTSDEFTRSLTSEMMLPARSVLLTFDDGWRSLHTVAAPLLRRYKIRATAYLITGVIAAERAALDPDAGAAAFVTWDEVQADADVIDFQSHSHWHARVFVSPRLVDFIHPRFDRHAQNLHVPVLRTRGHDDFRRSAELGTPIYADAPRFAGRRRFLDDEAVRACAVNAVAARGGAAFFADANWRRVLKAEITEHLAHHEPTTRYESEAETRAAIRGELVASRQAIGRALPGHEVGSLCFPWFAGSDLAIAEAQAAGYTSCFFGVEPGRRTNRPGEDPCRAVRLPSAYIPRLPGRGRLALVRVLAGMAERSAPGFWSGMRSASGG
jgi:peptidoglycan/xylan/chitin deacetylase (PgdA/CDA1 family)